MCICVDTLAPVRNMKRLLDSNWFSSEATIRDHETDDKYDQLKPKRERFFEHKYTHIFVVLVQKYKVILITISKKH